MIKRPEWGLPDNLQICSTASEALEREVLDVADGTSIDRLSSILVQKYQNLPLEIEKAYLQSTVKVPRVIRSLHKGIRCACSGSLLDDKKPIKREKALLMTIRVVAKEPLADLRTGPLA